MQKQHILGKITKSNKQTFVTVLANLLSSLWNNNWYWILASKHTYIFRREAKCVITNISKLSMHNSDSSNGYKTLFSTQTWCKGNTDGWLPMHSIHTQPWKSVNNHNLLSFHQRCSSIQFEDFISSQIRNRSKETYLSWKPSNYVIWNNQNQIIIFHNFSLSDEMLKGWTNSRKEKQTQDLHSKSENKLQQIKLTYYPHGFPKFQINVLQILNYPIFK